MIRLTACLALLLSLAACGTVYRDTKAPIVAQGNFDAARYTGLWYEIARFPVPFQTGCTAVTAEYGLLPDGTLSVLNICHEGTVDGPVKQISGTAKVTGPGQLRVQFASVPFIKAPYWVLWVDADYQTAVVGVPSGRAGWVLSRTPVISDDHMARAITVLRENGYDTDALAMTPQAAP